MNKKNNFTNVFCILTLLCGTNLFVANVLTNGNITSDLFLKDTLDTGMDFYIMVASAFKPIKIKLVEAISFYPPLALMLFRVIYLCIPREITSQWPTEGVWSEVLRGNSVDLRIYPETVLSFMLFIILCCFSIMVLLVFQKKGSIKLSIVFSGCCIFSYGMLFAFERGNIILLCIPLIMLFLLWKDSEKRYQRILSIIALVLAAGLKVYPAIFGVLLLTKRRWKEAVIAIVLGVIILCGPLIISGGLNSILKYASNVGGFSESAGLGSLHGFSLQVIAKSICHLLTIDSSNILKYVQWCAYILLVSGCVLSFFVKENWKKIALITSLVIIVPGTSMPYISTFLLFPFTAFLNEETGQHSKVTSWLYFFLFMLILLPYSLPAFLTFEPFTLTTANFVRQIAMLIFTVLILGDCIHGVFIRKRLKDEEQKSI